MGKNTGATKTPREKVLNLFPGMLQEACNRGGSLTFKVISGSMEPMLQVGDRVKVSRVEESRLHTGDIIAFRKGEGVIGHRIISRDKQNGRVYFNVRGDVGSVRDKIAAKDIIGKIYAIEKDDGEVVLDTARYIITNRLLGWRLRLREAVYRKDRQYPGRAIRWMLGPVWRWFQRHLVLHFSRKERQ